MHNVTAGIKWAISKYQSADKNEEITHFPMCALTLAAITARIFYLVVIDAPETENSGWLSALLGAAFSLPAILGAYFLMKKNDSVLENGIISAVGRSCYRILCLLLALVFTYETSALFTILTSSGAYATLYTMHKLSLLVPTSFAVIYACTKGGNGIGGAAEVWMRIYLILYTFILILEFDTMNASYIFPVWGPGFEGLLKTALSTMMYYCMIPVSFLLESGYSVKGRGVQKKIKPESILAVFLLCVIVSVLVLIVHSMMYPSLASAYHSRSSGMDLMLSNGRSNRTVQLPILIIWFSALALSSGYMLFCAGRLMNKALGERGRKCMFLLGLIALVIALFRLSGKKQASLFPVILGPAFCFVFFLIALLNFFSKKGERKK